MTEGGALAGKAAIVTGSSQGLGKEIARAYLGAGARVLICARGERDLSEAVRELSADPGCADRCAGVGGDISLKADVDRIIAEALRRFAKIDILVNNAGIQGPIGLIDEVDWDAWSDAVRVNLFGSVLMARAVIPQFRSRRRGKIIQLSGGGATGPRYGFGAYAASKTAVVRFAENLAIELREFNVDVNSIAPGALNTRMLDEMLEAGPRSTGLSAFNAAQRQRSRGGYWPAPACSSF